MTNLREVVILDAVRTPIGRHRGGLAQVRPDDLLARVLDASLKRTGIEPGEVDEVMAGAANQAGEDNRNVARMALLLAGFPDHVPGITLNRLCASSLSAVNQAARQIACGEAELILAGGVESMSRAPLVLPKGETAFANGNRTAFDTTLGWRFPNPKLEARFPLESMGQTAENLVEELEIPRGEQDEFALRSHERAIAAEREGRWSDERISVVIPNRKKGSVTVEKDEGPREDTSLEKLSELRPVFRKGGTVTAGNSSTLNDGAACVVVASRQRAQHLGKKPLARWIGGQAAGVDPRKMGIGPVPAVRKLLDRLSLRLEDIELIELNEAFAAQSLAVLRQLEIESRDTVNVNGGAIALGHPLGASGARILTTLIHQMKRGGARRGLAALCVGVGQGVATIVEANE